MLFRIVKIQLLQIAELQGYFKNSCWIKITANRLSYALGLHGEKKSMENWDIIKIGHV